MADPIDLAVALMSLTLECLMSGWLICCGISDVESLAMAADRFVAALSRFSSASCLARVRESFLAGVMTVDSGTLVSGFVWGSVDGPSLIIS